MKMNLEEKLKKYIKNLLVRIILIRSLIWDLGLIQDGLMYNFVINDGVISYERYETCKGRKKFIKITEKYILPYRIRIRKKAKVYSVYIKRKNSGFTLNRLSEKI